MSHTPAPWKAVRKEDQEWAINAPKGDPNLGMSAWYELITVYGSEDTPYEGAEVARSNALLVAAAPELLMALVRIEELDRIAQQTDDGVEAHVWDEAIFSARDAIIKARGW